MSETKQRVDLVVTGHTSDQPVEKLVNQILNLLDDHSPHLEFKLSDALLFNNGMTTIRDNITQDEAEVICQTLSTVGVICELRPTLQIMPKENAESAEITDLYTCPACGHRQPKHKDKNDGRMEACEACGIVGQRYQKKQRLQQVIQAESHKHENERAKRIREVLERAKQEEEAMLQQEARRMLGLAETPNKLRNVAAVLAVAVVLTGSFGTVYYLKQQPETPDEIADHNETDADNKTGIIIQTENIPPAAIEAVMEKGNKLASATSSAPTTSPAPESAAVPPNQAAAITPEQQHDINQTKITEALRNDAEQTQQQAPERKVLNMASNEAISTLEQTQIAQPRFNLLLNEHTENRRRIGQLLKLEEKDLADTIINKVTEPYPRVLLLLDILEWEIQHQQLASSRTTLIKIEKELTETSDVIQQALILGAISKAHLLNNAWQLAGQSLQQAPAKTTELTPISAQIDVLTRLANEQTLFGNQIAARQVLETADKLTEQLPEGVEPRSGSFVQIASGFAMLTDFNTANQWVSKVEDSAKRQKLAEFIDKLQHRVEQMRAEYLQTAQIPAK